MQRLLSIYFKCCYRGHWNELCSVLDYFLQAPTPSNVDKLKVCVKGAHQYCISNAAINSAVTALNNAGVLYKKYIDFEALYDDVRSIIGGIKGIGDLTIYDTALRIGFTMYPMVLPCRYVYLARGSKAGATKLLNPITPLNYREPACLFAPYFGNMSSHFIEDFLCVLKDYIYPFGAIPKTVTIPPYSPYCKCTCSQNLRDKVDGCCSSSNKSVCGSFCPRICDVNGNLDKEYLDLENEE